MIFEIASKLFLARNVILVFFIQFHSKASCRIWELRALQIDCSIHLLSKASFIMEDRSLCLGDSLDFIVIARGRND